MVKRKCNVLPGVETRYNLVITMPDMLRGPVVTQSAVGLAANSPPVPQIAIGLTGGCSINNILAQFHAELYSPIPSFPLLITEMWKVED